MGAVRLGAILAIMVIVGLGPLIYAFVLRWRERDAQGLVARHDPLALARLEWKRGRMTEEEYRQIEADLQGGSTIAQ